MRKKIFYIVITAVLSLSIFRIVKNNLFHIHQLSNLIEDFPLHEQPDNVTCGPTSAKMLLERYGIIISLDDLRKVALTDWYKGKINNKEIHIGGTLPDVLKNTLNHFGLPASYVIGNLNKLKYYIDQKRPPILLVRSGKQMWHYMIAIGYSETEIIFADPSGGFIRYCKNKTIENAWNFTSDLHAQDMRDYCYLCDGKGRLSWLLGPAGKCDFCGGTGKSTDYWKDLYLLAGYPPLMMIIPELPFP